MTRDRQGLQGCRGVGRQVRETRETSMFQIARGGVTGHPSIQPSTCPASPEGAVCGLSTWPGHSQSSPGESSLRQGGARKPLQPARPSFSTTHVLLTPKTPVTTATAARTDLARAINLTPSLLSAPSTLLTCPCATAIYLTFCLMPARASMPALD